MATQTDPGKGDTGKEKNALRNRLILLAAVIVALIVPMVVFLGQDLLKAAVSPCDSIFQQTSNSLTTKIKVLETEGEVQIGKEKLADLGERAQMTALNLKTCCTVLDTGKLNPEQFLQCKSNARRYEASVDSLLGLVRQAAAAKTQNQPAKVQQVTQSIATTVNVALKTSQSFNHQVVEVREKQAIAQLRITPPKEVEVAAQEQEPNNDVLNTNRIELGRWITGAIGAKRDNDYYAFVTPDVHRDYIRVDIQNRSVTWRPWLMVYNAQKAELGKTWNKTPGADLSYGFVAGPKTRFTLRIANYDSATQGAYLVRISATKAYDSFEPNDTILQAKPLAFGSPVEAGIMDRYDADFYKIETGDGGKYVVSIENRSTTLRPGLVLYNGNKAQLKSTWNKTPGANLSYELAGQPNAAYFVRVGTYDRGTSGAYTLTVKRR